MSDNGDNIIDFDDLVWDASTDTYYFHLNRDVAGGLTVVDGLDDLCGGRDNIVIVGNSHTLTGKGGIGLNLGNNAGMKVFGLQIDGFDYGVVGSGQDGLVLCDVDVCDAKKGGMLLQGNGMMILYADVERIGGPTKTTVVGIDVRGNDNLIDSAYVADLQGLTEVYAIGFSSYDHGGNALSYSILDGTNSKGWTFGLWSDNNADESAVYNTYMTGWDYVIGSVFTTNVESSTLEGQVIDYGAPSTFVDSTLIEHAAVPTGDQVLYGDANENFILGGDGNDLIFGASGHDDLVGGLGADTFLFIDPNPCDGALDRIHDFEQGVDKIRIDDVLGMAPTRFQEHGVYALGEGPVLVLNQHNDILYYDPDGFGGEAWVPVAYLYGVNLTIDDFIFT